MQIKERIRDLRFSEQETAYAKHYLKMNARLAVMTAVILILFVLGYLMPSVLIYASLSMFGGVSTKLIETSEWIATFFISICMLAFLLPLYQFRFLMKRSSSDLYFSLPIERNRLFYVHYWIGLGYMGCVSLLICLPALLNATWRYPIFMMMLLILILFVLGICLYTFFTFLVVRCHTMLDALIVCIVYTLLPVLVYYAMMNLIRIAGNDALYAVYHESAIFSVYRGSDLPMESFVRMFEGLISVPWQMNEWVKLFSERITGFNGTMLCLAIEFLLWIIIAFVCYRSGALCFVRIKSEESEQTTRSALTYPLLIPLVTFLLLLMMSEGSICSWMVWFLFAGYLIAHFFAKRKIKVDWKTIAIYVALVLMSSAVYHTMVETKLFHQLYEIPQTNDIESITVELSCYERNISVYSDEIRSQKQIQTVVEANETWLPMTTKETSWDDLWGVVVVQYQLKDGTLCMRQYDFSYQAQDDMEKVLDSWLNEGLVKPYTDTVEDMETEALPADDIPPQEQE